MKIAISGAGGMIGSKLSQYLSAEHDVLPLNRQDLDITDYEAIRGHFANKRIDLMINCAVIGVDECERNPARAEQVNIAGSLALAKATAGIGAEFMHFSTSYVFGGKWYGRNYTIDDDPHPVNVYGHTKLAAEHVIRNASSRCYIIRTSWVYGIDMQNFLSRVHHNIRSGKRMCAIGDVWSNTTYLVDLLKRVSEILNRHHYGIYQVVNSGVCSHYSFAMEAARLIGLSDTEADQMIEKSNDFEAKRLAKRPHYTSMRCLLSEKLGLSPMRDWRDALADYIRADIGGNSLSTQSVDRLLPLNTKRQGDQTENSKRGRF